MSVVAGWVAAARRILVFTGAGISTESGIPDFRGPDGRWRTDDPSLATIQAYVADPQVRRARWRARLASPYDSAVPNAAHRAIVALERTGRVVVVTQNIDGLHQRAGSTDVVELHGNLREAMCLGCVWRAPVGDVLARVAAGNEDPDCPRCGGILKVATISFGQPLVTADLDRATAAAEEADVCLAVGSSLTVWPAAGVPLATARCGGRLVIVNDGETGLDEAAAARIGGRVGTTLPALVAASGGVNTA